MGIHMGRNNHIQTQNAALELMNLQNQPMKDEFSNAAFCVGTQ